MTCPEDKIGMICHLIGGQVSDTFNTHFNKPMTIKTNGEIRDALKLMAATIFQENSVTNQHQFLCHELKKPNKLSARGTLIRLRKVNAWFKYFPSDGQNCMLAVSELGADEIREIFYRLLPQVWRRKMEENPQVDRVKAGIDGIVEYAERLETMEQVYEGQSQNGKGKNLRAA